MHEEIELGFSQDKGPKEPILSFVGRFDGLTLLSVATAKRIENGSI